MKLKLSKAQAAQALKVVSGSAAGIEIAIKDKQYVAARGMSAYRLTIEDMWPILPRIKTELIFAAKTVETVYINPLTMEVDWKITEIAKRNQERSLKYELSSGELDERT